MSEPRRTPQRVGAIVTDVLKARGLAEGIERASVAPAWADLVGPQIARVSTPTGFHETTLFVEVRSSAWLMELEMMERRILARLNAGRKSGTFKRIMFRLAQST